MMLVGDFLVGSLLTLLLPTLMLIALVVWYMRAVRKVPETTEAELAAAAPTTAAATEGPELSHTSQQLD